MPSGKGSSWAFSASRSLQQASASSSSNASSAAALWLSWTTSSADVLPLLAASASPGGEIKTAAGATTSVAGRKFLPTALNEDGVSLSINTSLAGERNRMLSSDQSTTGCTTCICRIPCILDASALAAVSCDTLTIERGAQDSIVTSSACVAVLRQQLGVPYIKNCSASRCPRCQSFSMACTMASFKVLRSVNTTLPYLLM
jgi:hypothetical protein